LNNESGLRDVALFGVNFPIFWGSTIKVNPSSIDALYLRDFSTVSVGFEDCRCEENIEALPGLCGDKLNKIVASLGPCAKVSLE
jgi:hypothetical protein